LGFAGRAASLEAAATTPASADISTLPAEAPSLVSAQPVTGPTVEPPPAIGDKVEPVSAPRHRVADHSRERAPMRLAGPKTDTPASGAGEASVQAAPVFGTGIFKDMERIGGF
jgi:hypothetical protein